MASYLKSSSPFSLMSERFSKCSCTIDIINLVLHDQHENVQVKNGAPAKLEHHSFMLYRNKLLTVLLDKLFDLSCEA